MKRDDYIVWTLVAAAAWVLWRGGAAAGPSQVGAAAGATTGGTMGPPSRSVGDATGAGQPPLAPVGAAPWSAWGYPVAAGDTRAAQLRDAALAAQARRDRAGVQSALTALHQHLYGRVPDQADVARRASIAVPSSPAAGLVMGADAQPEDDGRFTQDDAAEMWYRATAGAFVESLGTVVGGIVGAFA